MPFVLDASIVVCWAFADEDDPKAVRAMDQMLAGAAFAPDLMWFEVRNALIMSERRQRTTAADTARFLRELAEFPIHFDRTPDEAEVLRIARAHRLTVYDAAYVELTRRLGIALATLDGDMARAARREGIALI